MSERPGPEALTGGCASEADGTGAGVVGERGRDGPGVVQVDDAGLLHLRVTAGGLSAARGAQEAAVGSGSGVVDSSLMALIVPNGRW